MNTPTKITFSRIIAIGLMIITLVVLYFVKLANPTFTIPNVGNTNISWLFLGLFIFFVLASFTDFLDGFLARKNNQVTDLGKFLDPVADKLLVNSIVIFLINPQLYASYTVNSQMNFSLWCAILLIVRDIVVDALRFIAAQKGVVIGANIFGKAKTVLEMIAVSLVLLNGWPFIFDVEWPVRIADIFVYLATIASVVSGIIYLVKYGYVLKEGKKNESGTN